MSLTLENITSYHHPGQVFAQVFIAEQALVEAWLQTPTPDQAASLASLIAKKYATFFPLANVETLPAHINILQHLTRYFGTRARSHASELLLNDDELNVSQPHSSDSSLEPLINRLKKEAVPTLLDRELRHGLLKPLWELAAMLQHAPDKKLHSHSTVEAQVWVTLSAPYYDAQRGFYLVYQTQDSELTKRLIVSYYAPGKLSFHLKTLHQGLATNLTVDLTTEPSRTIQEVKGVSKLITTHLDHLKRGQKKLAETAIGGQETTLPPETINLYQKILTNKKYPSGEFTFPVTDSLENAPLHSLRSTVKDSPISLQYQVQRDALSRSITVCYQPSPEFTQTLSADLRADFAALPNTKICQIMAVASWFEVTIFEGSQSYRYFIYPEGNVETVGPKEIPPHHLDKLQEWPLRVDALLQQVEKKPIPPAAQENTDPALLETDPEILLSTIQAVINQPS